MTWGQPVSSQNDLVAQAPDDGVTLEGAGVVESGIALFSGPQPGDWEGMATAINGVVLGLDALSFVANPLEELGKAGVGWLIEQIDFLNWPIDQLAGDPGDIEATAQTWNNIADHLEAVADDYEAALRKTDTWIGDAAEGYRSAAAEYNGALRDAAWLSRNFAQGIVVAGMVCATIRGIVIDLISTFVTDRIEGAIMAAATALLSAGGSVAVFIANTILDAVELIDDVSKRIARVSEGIGQFVEAMGIIGKRILVAADSLKEFADKMGPALTSMLKYTRTSMDQATGGSAADGKVSPSETSNAAPGPDLNLNHERTPTGGRMTGHIDDGE